MRTKTGNGPIKAKVKGNGERHEKRLTRLQVMLSMDELKALDNFRFEKRMPTRAAAIREILRRGLAATGFTLANDESRSRDFGVLKNHES